MLKFRYHTGSLQDSLLTTIEFNGFESLLKHIKDKFGVIGIGEVKKDGIHIKYYGYDERVNQDLFVFLLNEQPIGFIWEE